MDWLNHIVGLLTLVLVIFAVLTLAYFIWKDRHQDLKIIKAEYGKNNIYSNITAHLNDQIANNRLEILISNDIIDDPVRGVPKIAKIKYWHNGRRHKREYVEGETAILP